MNVERQTIILLGRWLEKRLQHVECYKCSGGVFGEVVQCQGVG